MGIHNTNMYEKAIVAMAKQSVTLEVLSYHASASMDDAGRLRVSDRTHPINQCSVRILKSNSDFFILFQQTLKIPSSAYFHLHDFKFDDIHMEDDDTLKVWCFSLLYCCVVD